MATQKITPFAVPAQSLPQVKTVTQDRLAEIIMLRQQIEELEKQLGEAQTDVKSALESGAEVEAGLFRASLKISSRTNVSWKSVCERELGEDYTKRVLAATKPDQYVNLIVTA